MNNNNTILLPLPSVHNDGVDVITTNTQEWPVDNAYYTTVESETPIYTNTRWVITPLSSK